MPEEVLHSYPPPLPPSLPPSSRRVTLSSHTTTPSFPTSSHPSLPPSLSPSLPPLDPGRRLLGGHLHTLPPTALPLAAHSRLGPVTLLSGRGTASGGGGADGHRVCACQGTEGGRVEGREGGRKGGRICRGSRSSIETDSFGGLIIYPLSSSLLPFFLPSLPPSLPSPPPGGRDRPSPRLVRRGCPHLRRP